MEDMIPLCTGEAMLVRFQELCKVECHDAIVLLGMLLAL